jgi:hypothetical protein
MPPHFPGHISGHSSGHAAGRRTRCALVAALTTLGLSSVSCGASVSQPSAAATSPAQNQCHQQWREVAKSVAGLDKVIYPSALATRWVTVLATVDYYLKTNDGSGCQIDVERQIDAITQLRKFSIQLQPYDMAFQADQVSADVERYLADPLPAAVHKPHGKVIRPPTKSAVTQAISVLNAHAAAANDYLAPGWGQLASVELTDATQVSAELGDLAQLAHESQDWNLCRGALAVIAAALNAPQAATPSATPTSTPTGTPTPTTSPSTTPPTTGAPTP